MGYNLYLAKVVGVAIESDSRIQIRILPQMEDIPENMCPRWPCFFRDEGFTGNVNDIVWVLCDDEFSTGYILGIANYNTFVEDTFTEYSIPEGLQQKGKDILLDLKAETLSYNDIKIDYWDQSCIHFIEKSTGGKIIVFSSGTIYIMRPKEFIISIGKTKIAMNADGISFAGNNIKLQSDYIGLGNNPIGKVLVTTGTAADSASVSKNVSA